MDQEWTIPEGTDVIGVDDHKVGEVVAVHADYLVVEKGFFFPTDYYIPSRAVATYDGDKVFLNVTKDEALHQGWDSFPGEDSVGAASGYTTNMDAIDEVVDGGGWVEDPNAPVHSAPGNIPPPINDLHHREVVER